MRIRRRERPGPSGPIRMFFGLTSPCTSARLVASVRSRKRAEPARKRRMRASGRAQVGIDPDRFERVVVRECGRRVGVGGASRVNEREIAPDRGGEFRLDAPREKLASSRAESLPAEDSPSRRDRPLRLPPGCEEQREESSAPRRASKPPPPRCGRPAPPTARRPSVSAARASRRSAALRPRRAGCRTKRRRSAA